MEALIEPVSIVVQHRLEGSIILVLQDKKGSKVNIKFSHGKSGDKIKVNMIEELWWLLLDSVKLLDSNEVSN